MSRNLPSKFCRRASANENVQRMKREVEMIKVQDIAEGAETRTPANKQHFFKNILFERIFRRLLAVRWNMRLH